MRRTLVPALVALAATTLTTPAAVGEPGEPPGHTTPPTIFISTPAHGQAFERGSTVLASYRCHDLNLTVCAGPVDDGAPLPTANLGTFGFRVVAEDDDGNTSERTHSYTVRDTTPPTVAISTPGADASYTQGAVVPASFSCSDGGFPVTCTAAVAGSPVSPGGALPTSTLGPKTFTVTATDAAGNRTVVSRTYHVVDRAHPTVTITTPADGAEYARGSVVAAEWSCADEAGGSGIATCTGTVPNGSPVDTSSLGQHTVEVTAVDNAGNQTLQRSTYTVVDATAPAVTLTRPVDGARFTRGQVVTADYACADEVGGSGLVSCTGTVADGARLPTRTTGTFTFTVTAVDGEGNETVATASYRVVAPLCAGRRVTVMLGLGDRPTPRADVILGTSTRNVIDAGGGNDVVCALGGNDAVKGGPGSDRLDGGAGLDHLNGGQHRDTCIGGPHRDTATSCEVRRGIP